ncbi:alpha beta-hydrolase [Stemphylium lycopersici]|uniref:Alpha beta-hydrolase n=1 Tax=Stemphylium lycopersici TaxID=183478 RepID=A0A364NAG4_STELY|nr:alpha beta-hydrolase [Stemphylium lycopersici]
MVDHARLGAIKCLHKANDSFIKILGLPYGTVSQRFARANLLRKLSDANSKRTKDVPWGSVKSDAANIPLPTFNLPEDEEQSEDCLNLSIHLPQICIDEERKLRLEAKLPVFVFVHGGAYFLGSANRPYYNPGNLVHHAIGRNTPIIFVSINYRLGALGFLHSNHARDLVPENNGLHDQVVAFEWLHKNIEGFGGDVGSITAIGKSAGGESVSVHTMHQPLFKRAITFSGTPVTMPTMTPDEHHNNFLSQAKKLGITTKEEDGRFRDAKAIAKVMINIDVSKIWDLAWVGLPCTKNTFFPFERPSMELARKGKLAPPD